MKNKSSNVLKIGLFIVVALIFIITNPTQSDLKKHIKEQEVVISLVSAVAV